jgi:hypothetical protein
MNTTNLLDKICPVCGGKTRSWSYADTEVDEYCSTRWQERATSVENTDDHARWLIQTDLDIVAFDVCTKCSTCFT